jgi:hypothetical protein
MTMDAQGWRAGVDTTEALRSYQKRMDEHFDRIAANMLLAERILPTEWRPIDSYHLIAGEPLQPVWRKPVTRRWFAWRPVKTATGWAWLQYVKRTVIAATRRPDPPLMRRRVVFYRKEL